MQRFSRMSARALWLLVWQRTTSVLVPRAPSTAARTILWDTVFVNRTSRSGLPTCFPNSALIWVNTFALHLKFLQICLYWLTILSCPPTITTLMCLSLLYFMIPPAVFPVPSTLPLHWHPALRSRWRPRRPGCRTARGSRESPPMRGRAANAARRPRPDSRRPRNRPYPILLWQNPSRG